MNKGVNRICHSARQHPRIGVVDYIAVGVFRWGAPSFDLFLMFVGLSVPLFLIPFGLVHTITWVVRGFKQ